VHLSSLSMSDPVLSVAVTTTLAAAVGFLLTAQAAKERRRRRRHYLTRLSLPVVYVSAWRAVLTSIDDRGLLNTTGFDRPAFRHLLSLFSPVWDQTRRRERDVGPADVLGLVLQYLNSTARCKTLCQVFAIPPASLSRYLRMGLAMLHQVIALSPHRFFLSTAVLS
jgi:hypothetical protein